MKLLFTAVLLICSITSRAQKVPLVVTTDIGQDPDDMQSLIRLLFYANDFEILGLIANADANYEHEAAKARVDLIFQAIDAYERDFPNLRRADPSFPAADGLRNVVKLGTEGNGTAIPFEKYTGIGKNTPGSDHIIRVVDSLKSPEWIAVSVWGGACDLAQALWDVKQNRSEKEMAEFCKKMRVYMIGKQDSSNQWILDNFPDLWVILAEHPTDKWKSVYRGMFLGGDMDLTGSAWFDKNVVHSGNLGSMYPRKAYTGANPHKLMKEGDSPAMLYFVRNGLNDFERPEYGGWGGRFRKDSPNRFTDTEVLLSDTLALHTISRWRGDFQADFARRAAWAAGSVNLAPEIEVEVSVKPDFFELDASQSSDPEATPLTFSWEIYRDISSCPFRNLPSESKIRIEKNWQGECHLILRASDESGPSLKRVVLKN